MLAGWLKKFLEVMVCNWLNVHFQGDFVTKDANKIWECKWESLPFVLGGGRILVRKLCSYSTHNQDKCWKTKGFEKVNENDWRTGNTYGKMHSFYIQRLK